ncbi:hypothetical protein ACJMK2_003249, partial [Sinanodonta woodiana]
KRIMSKFRMKKLQEDVISVPDMQMSTSFGAYDDGVYFHADYDNYIDHLTDSTSREEPRDLARSPKYNSMEPSTKYDSAMAIPRPRPRDNQPN